MINTFVMIGSLLDLVLTYKFLSLYKQRFPKKDYTIVETNPMIRYAVRSMGLLDGILISGLVILFILGILLNLIPYHWKFFLAGVYYMMVAFHLINFLALKRMGVKT